MSVGLTMVAGMRNLRLGTSLIALSVLAILVLRFVPGTWLIDIRFVNPTISYVVLGLIFYVIVYFLGSQSLEYFRLPRLHFKTAIALGVATILVIIEISRSDNLRLDPWIAVRGTLFLLAIGFGEEMVSRAFIFGALHKFGIMKAILISSLLFGLMHLNLYMGADWDPWSAYWHVMDTFGFGVLACALMIVTRSIWVAVIFHALCNWSVIFDKASDVASGRHDWGVSFWEGIRLPLSGFAFMVALAMLLLWIDRGVVPTWVYRLAMRWKLVEPSFGRCN